MKKLYAVSGLIAVFALITPLFASAQSNTDVTSQIQSLMSQITALEQQLQTLVHSAASSSAAWNASSTPPSMGQGMPGMPCFSFGRDLSEGAQGSDVMQLQQMLQGDGFFSASTTGFFGPLTAHALASFQTSFGISASSTGFFGPLTRTFLQSRCGGMASSTPPQQWQSTSTPSAMPMIPWHPATSTGSGPSWGPAGSSTPPQPCMQNASTTDANSAAAALFVPHVVLPIMFFNPCAPHPMPTVGQQ